MDEYDECDSTRHDFCLLFVKSVDNRVIELTLNRFSSAGFSAHLSPGGYLIMLCASSAIVEMEAEANQIRKWHKVKRDMCIFDRREKNAFSCTPPTTTASSTKMAATNDTGSSVFSSSERSYLVECALRHITIGDELSNILTTKNRNEGLIHALHRLDFLNGFDPLHLPTERNRIWRSVYTSFITPPSTELRNYFGESVAFYFAWMSFYTKSLLPPGIFASILWTISRISNYSTTDRNPYVPFYTLSIIIWGFLFTKFWERRSNKLAFNWDTYNYSSRTETMPDFHGVLKVSPVTGKTELYYPQSKRRLWYLLSIVVTGGMLLVAFFTMICSLNLQGYVTQTTRFGDKNPFYIAILSKCTEAGAIFDPKGPVILSCLPAIIHSTIIFVLNQLIYRKIATYFTECENHKTRTAFDTSLILKRFFFDAFDSYIALFYLVFYEADVEKLASCLISLYMTDSIRRILLESIIPLITFYMRSRSDEVVYKLKKKIDDFKSNQTTSEFYHPKLYSEVLADEYEDFDDYLEMVIQFGYIILFASACPIASLFSVLTSWIEVKADAFKVLFVTKRPNVRRSKGIGIWHQIIAGLVWLSVLTNVFIFGVSSEQLLQWCPWFYEHVSLHDPVSHKLIIDQELREGAGRYVLGLVFFLEHVMIGVGLLIQLGINSIPKDTRDAIDAREYRKNIIYLNSIGQKTD